MPVPRWDPILNNKVNIDKSFIYSTIEQEPFYTFTFLNQERTLVRPIKWDSPRWSRLWTFNLHYFDWIRESIDASITSSSRFTDTRTLDLINDWIKSNTPGHGDAWHSYTISLRLRNWIYLLSLLPDTVTNVQTNSIWLQTSWLFWHLESPNGGNHYLENLVTLCISSLNFSGAYPRYIFNASITHLQSELSRQILPDGAHNELTPSYHILILDRLLELACLLKRSPHLVPKWLDDTISKMYQWLIQIQLYNNTYPRFNDSTFSSCPPLSDVLIFARNYLYGERSELTPTRELLLQWSDNNAHCSHHHTSTLNQRANLSPTRTHSSSLLPHSGLVILRPDQYWELFLKCVSPCPPHLPGHCHSDQLSFEVFHKGIPILSEAGTSTYDKNSLRYFERSGAAHNVLEIAPNLPFQFSPWYEPVDVWSSFRAGRKSHPLMLGLKDHCANYTSGTGSHNGFSRYLSSYDRTITPIDVSEKSLILQVIDTLSCKQSIFIRLWFHFSPFIDLSLSRVQTTIRPVAPFSYNHVKTPFSMEYGKKVIRDSLCVRSRLTPGEHQITSIISLNL